jgi:hypothetical protein
MNLEAIKAKLNALNNNGQEKEKIDYDKIFWRPITGKHNVRIVPSVFDPSFPFKELKFHYNIGRFPMIALSNFGKQDPIEEFVKELRKTSDKDNWSLSGKLSPKTRIFAPVIVRGEEDKGVRLWSFGTNIFKALLALAEDEDIGDYTDVMNGYDMVVEQTPGNPYPTTTVRIKPKTSPLSTDNTKVDLWLKTQPNPLEVFTQYDYEFIKKQLQGYLSPGETQEPSAEASEPTTPIHQPPAPAQATDLDKTLGSHKTDFTLEGVSAGKKSTVSKFDDLFNE